MAKSVLNNLAVVFTTIPNKTFLFINFNLVEYSQFVLTRLAVRQMNSYRPHVACEPQLYVRPLWGNNGWLLLETVKYKTCTECKVQWYSIWYM